MTAWKKHKAYSKRLNACKFQKAANPPADCEKPSKNMLEQWVLPCFHMFQFQSVLECFWNCFYCASCNAPAPAVLWVLTAFKELFVADGVLRAAAYQPCAVKQPKKNSGSSTKKCWTPTKNMRKSSEILGIPSHQIGAFQVHAQTLRRFVRDLHLKWYGWQPTLAKWIVLGCIETIFQSACKTNLRFRRCSAELTPQCTNQWIRRLIYWSLLISISVVSSLDHVTMCQTRPVTGNLSDGYDVSHNLAIWKYHTLEWVGYGSTDVILNHRIWVIGSIFAI